MTEQVLGVLRLKKASLGRSKFEAMFLTKDRVVVAPVCSGTMPGLIGGVIGGAVGAVIYMTAEQNKAKPKIDAVAKSPLNELLNQEGTYSIPLSEIKKVELIKVFGDVIFKIYCEKNKHEWICQGIPEVKKSNYEDYKKMLLQEFGGLLKAK
jgi:hypothetical protein